MQDGLATEFVSPPATTTAAAAAADPSVAWADESGGAEPEPEQAPRLYSYMGVPCAAARRSSPLVAARRRSA
eukprot:SAG11_NODE_8594_length_997_cov_20.888641_2_plen_71_part_01